MTVIWKNKENRKEKRNCDKEVSKEGTRGGKQRRTIGGEITMKGGGEDMERGEGKTERQRAFKGNFKWLLFNESLEKLLGEEKKIYDDLWDSHFFFLPYHSDS